MNKQCCVVFIRNVIAVLVLHEGITRELVIDEHTVLVIVFQLQSIVDIVRSNHIKAVALCRNRHLSVVILSDINLLHDWDRGRTTDKMIGVIRSNRVVSVWSNTNHPPLIAHSQDGMNRINLLMSLHISLNRGRRGLYNLFEEIVYLVIRATSEEKSHCCRGKYETYVFI